MTHLTVQQLSSSLDGALTGPSLELVVRHLAACHECRDRQARLAKHDDALRRLLGQDPDDLFMDDLTRRAEEQVLAIARGLPAPAMSTSVPLIHEEDPYAPVEPPPPPPRPELGRAGELAQEAGWGRIGIKPTASTQAPESNPEDAQRLLEALESGNVADFTELTAQGLQEHTHIDGPTFDLPAWIKEQSKAPATRRDGPREVPKLNLFFADLDERAAGLTREAVDEVFRRDPDQPGHPVAAEDPNDGSGSADDAAPRAPHAVPAPHAPQAVPAPHAAPAPMWPTLSLVPPPGPTGVPPGHAAFAPPDWAPEAEPPSTSPDTAPEPFELTAAPDRTARRGAGSDRAVVMALVSVGGLLLIVLALQLAPHSPARPKRGDGVLGLQVPKVTLVRKDLPADEPSVPEPRIESAATAAAVEQVVSPQADTVLAAEPTHFEMPPVIPPDTAQPAVTVPRPVAAPAVNKPRPAPRRPAARGARPAAEPATPASPAEDVSWPLLCGVVLDAAGRPLAGARVTVTEIAFSMRTDARGRFCLSAPSGMQHLLVEASGFIETRQAVTLAENSPELRLQLHTVR